MTELLLTADQAVRCGLGERERCCIYLAGGAKGLECGRVLLWFKASVEARRATMSAQRMPTEPFPACQLQDNG